MLPTDSIDRVYRRRIPGRIAMAASTVIAVKRKTQLLRRNLIVGRPDLGQGVGQLGCYGDGDFWSLPPRPPLIETFSTDRLASFFGWGTCTSLLLVLLEKVLLFS